MSFDNNSLTKIGGVPPAPALYSYITADSITTVLGAGYFNTAFNTLLANDLINCTCSDGVFSLRVLAIGTRSVTVAIATSTGNTLGTNDLGVDAWGRQKVVHDHSLFHGVWTYDVPNRLWEEYTITSGTYAPVSSTGTNVVSEGNALVVKSGTTAGNGNAVFSKRHPRYQPNRGHLYSTACRFPNPTGDGRRRFGLLDRGDEDGVYFELEGDGSSWELYACRKNDSVVENRQALSSLLPSNFDPEKAHVYDIQFQWRGAGGYKFFVDLEETYHEDLLGTLEGVSIRIPALPCAFESETDTTTELEVVSACVDVSTEGGQVEGREFISVSTGTTFVQADATGRATLAIKMPRTISYGGGSIPNTRDIVANKISSWTRDEAAVQIYVARDVAVSNLDGLTWTNVPDDLNVQYLVGGETSALDDAFQLDRGSMQLLINEWHDLEEKNVITNPDQTVAPFYVTAGDIVVVCVQSISGNDNNATTIYLSEEL